MVLEVCAGRAAQSATNASPHPRAVPEFTSLFKRLARWLFLDEKATWPLRARVEQLWTRCSRKNKDAARVGHPKICLEARRLGMELVLTSEFTKMCRAGRRNLTLRNQSGHR